MKSFKKELNTINYRYDFVAPFKRPDFVNYFIPYTIRIYPSCRLSSLFTRERMVLQAKLAFQLYSFTYTIR
ncbi:MAG: hypothetical protein PHH76_04905, partial [Methanothrix soehngenii]|uniref:hypothetical protein n=1 Tax=Methanothrix soehngenii TaxID=2223 RepID=UPI0023F1147B